VSQLPEPPTFMGQI